MAKIEIVPATVEDLERILEIEERAYPIPWNRAQMESIFYQNIVRQKLLYDGTLIGYTFVSIILDEGHLLHITVDPKYHGMGLGRLLLDSVVTLCEAQQLSTLFLEVRIGNKPARTLYEKYGFNQIGVRKGYYPCLINGREDAIVMAYSLTTAFDFK